MNAFLYLRVSSEDQVENTSLDSQERDCQAYAAGNGYTVTKVYREEGETAKTALRPKLQQMLLDAGREKPEAVIVWKLDRMARKTADYHAIRSCLSSVGTKILSATETIEESPAGRFLETMLAGVAQFDNEVRGQRTKIAMDAVVAKGGWAWKAPIGYKNGRTEDGTPTLVPDPDTFPSVQKVLKLYAHGHLDKADVWKRLEVRKQRATKILKHTVYGGFTDRPPHGEVKGLWEPAVTREEWNMIQARLSGAPQLKVVKNQDYPFRGILFCDGCNTAITASASRGRHGKKYAYYHCPQCGNRARVDAIHKEWLELLEGARLTEAEVDEVMEIVAKEIRQEEQVVNSELQAKRKKLVELGEKKDKLLDLLLKGTIDEQTYERRVAAVAVEMGQIEIVEQEKRNEFYDLDYSLKWLRNLLGTPDKMWIEGDLDAKVLIIKAFCRYPPRLLLGTPGKSRAAKRLGLVGGSGDEMASPRGPSWKLRDLITVFHRFHSGALSALRVGCCVEGRP